MTSVPAHRRAVLVRSAKNMSETVADLYGELDDADMAGEWGQRLSEAYRETRQIWRLLEQTDPALAPDVDEVWVATELLRRLADAMAVKYQEVLT